MTSCQMSNIDKQALREAAEKHGDDDVLALLDELEAAEKRIADYQELISGLVDLSSSILREVERMSGEG